MTVTEDARKWILDKTVVGPHATVLVRYAARLQKYIEDPLSEALIQGTFEQRPAFIEVYLENNQLFYRAGRGREDRRRAALQPAVTRALEAKTKGSEDAPL